jgi:hypothetical protein
VVRAEQMRETEKGRRPSCNGKYSHQSCLEPRQCGRTSKGVCTLGKCRHRFSLGKVEEGLVSWLQWPWLFL